MITIRTQREWDELPELFDEFTLIEIRSGEWIRIRQTPENSRVEAKGLFSCYGNGLFSC